MYHIYAGSKARDAVGAALAAEEVALPVSAGRRGARSGRNRIAQMYYLKLSQPASGANRPPNFCASARKVETTFSGPRVRA